MNKSKLLTLILLICVCFFMGACGNSKETIIEDFLTEFYTVDSVEDFDMMEYQMTYFESENVKKLKSYMTDEAFKKLTAPRDHMILVMAANFKNIDISISDINVEEYSKTESDIVYNYKAKLTFEEDKSNEEYNVSGQITLNKVQGDMIITKVNKIDIPNKIFEVHKEMTKPKDN